MRLTLKEHAIAFVEATVIAICVLIIVGLLTAVCGGIIFIVEYIGQFTLLPNAKGVMSGIVVMIFTIYLIRLQE